MNTALIAKSYWRSLLRGTRTFESVPPALREEVLTLARTAAERGETVPADVAEAMKQAGQEQQELVEP